MIVEQRFLNKNNSWVLVENLNLSEKKCLVFAFGNRKLLEKKSIYNKVKSFYPNSDIIFSSTSGEIFETKVFDSSVVITAIYFEKSSYKIKDININSFKDSCEAGKSIALEYLGSKPVNIFVLSDGQLVNGSNLVKGLQQDDFSNTPITGALAGDDDKFEKTLVSYNSLPKEGEIVAIAFYGENLKIAYGSMGGWTPFGTKRIITKSEGNKLYELDGKSALDLYKTYLGDKAKELPGSALLFPLSIKLDNNKSIVRTILSIDENGVMIFAGEVPEGSTARLMKANFDKLIDGAILAAEETTKFYEGEADLAILISCVGRKLVLNQRIEEEVEEAKKVLGKKVKITGLYSYGEISPISFKEKCELHNQTMTITTFKEL